MGYAKTCMGLRVICAAAAAAGLDRALNVRHNDTQTAFGGGPPGVSPRAR